MSELFGEITAALEHLADPRGAESAKYFFKDQPIDPRGISAEELRRIAREFHPRVKELSVAARERLCTNLWATGKLEDGALACYLYYRFEKQCGAREFALFTRWLDRYVHNWAHTDGLSVRLLGVCIANDPALIDDLDAWTRSKNRWKRRAAAVALIHSAKRGKHTRAIFCIAAPLIEDPDEMVQKGVGWLLKETYPQKPAETVHFLIANRTKTTRLVLRYAAEKMTATDKARVLAR
jgi:3-methyladenine DNA glycosylase AlkD